MRIFKLFLLPSQVEDLSIQIRGRKMMEDLVNECEVLKIASRRTVFLAMDSETYTPTSNKHRGVTETAIDLLRQIGYKFDVEQEKEAAGLAEA